MNKHQVAVAADRAQRAIERDLRNRSGIDDVMAEIRTTQREIVREAIQKTIESPPLAKGQAELDQATAEVVRWAREVVSQRRNGFGASPGLARDRLDNAVSKLNVLEGKPR